MKEALLYQKLENKIVRCNLCGHRCTIKPDESGICKVRQNLDGKLYTLVYGRAISQQVDPIEKKPLFHFLPGSRAYSVATVGCNLQCQWCQNWQIAQAPRLSEWQNIPYTSPEELVESALISGSQSIAYTYTEPTIFFEYAFDTAKLAHQAGMANLFITNGYMTGEMLDLFHPWLDAANVDLKAFRQRTYARYTGARLQTVLDSMKKIKALGIWLEVTSLLIPEVNDDTAEIEDMAKFIAEELGADTPWHISRFFPHYKMADTPPTPPKTLHKAYQIGKDAGLEYVYMGNIPGESSTICPQCGEVLIRRTGYQTRVLQLIDGKCGNCGHPIPGVWEFSA